MNQLTADCLRDDYFPIQLGDHLLTFDEHQIANRGGVTYDDHRAQALWRGAEPRGP